MSEVIVVSSGKGGTGKSTISVCLGNSFAKMGRKVLLIDCDAGMRGLDIMLGVSKSLVFDIADVVSGNCKTEHIIYPCPYIENLFLIPAPQNVEDEISSGILKQFINSIKKDYDVIIIDCPAGVGKSFEIAVAPATKCLVVANAEPTSVRGCQRVKSRLLEIGKSDIKLIINRFNKKSFKELNAYYDLDEVIDATGIQLLGLVTENKAVVSAIQKGTSYDCKCVTIKAIDNIAKRLEGQNIPLAIK